MRAGLRARVSWGWPSFLRDEGTKGREKWMGRPFIGFARRCASIVPDDESAKTERVGRDRIGERGARAPWRERGSEKAESAIVAFRFETLGGAYREQDKSSEESGARRGTSLGV
ncbi:hypothetical protein KM043_007336 [Ampulex compressa]|nr:hypothetical protein KM043_007336 [Ampulex compressa]